MTVPEIRGEFTKIDLKAPGTGHSLPPLAAAQSVMIGELARLQAPKLSANPEPEDFEDVADYLLRVAAVVDRFILEVGIEVKSTATCGIDVSLFDRQLANALEGFALHDIDAAAERIREDRNEVQAAIRNRQNARSMIDDIYSAFGMNPRSLIRNGDR